MVVVDEEDEDVIMLEHWAELSWSTDFSSGGVSGFFLFGMHGAGNANWELDEESSEKFRQESWSIAKSLND